MRTSFSRTALGLVFAAGALLAAEAASANPITINEDSSLFGRLNQRAITACGNNTEEDKSQACGPVAAANSFVYLQNRYPSIYGNSLVPAGDPATEQSQVADTLGGAQYMSCSCNGGGTTLNNFINGKQNYFNDNAPGTTTIESRTFGSSTSGADFAWLAAQLLKGQDVELLLGFYQTDADNDLLRTGGHYVTVTGVGFNDTNGNNTFDPEADTPTEIFLDDPWGFDQTTVLGSVLSDNDLTAVNVTLEFTADGAGPDNNDFAESDLSLPNYLAGNTTLIDAGVAESPIPEPGTVVLFGSALVGLGWLRKKPRVVALKEDQLSRVLALTALAASIVLSAAPAMAGGTSVPEPASMTLMGAGIAAVGIVKLVRRKKK